MFTEDPTSQPFQGRSNIILDTSMMLEFFGAQRKCSNSLFRCRKTHPFPGNESFFIWHIIYVYTYNTCIYMYIYIYLLCHILMQYMFPLLFRLRWCFFRWKIGPTSLGVNFPFPTACAASPLLKVSRHVVKPTMSKDSPAESGAVVGGW